MEDSDVVPSLESSPLKRPKIAQTAGKNVLSSAKRVRIKNYPKSRSCVATIEENSPLQESRSAKVAEHPRLPTKTRNLFDSLTATQTDRRYANSNNNNASSNVELPQDDLDLDWLTFMNDVKQVENQYCSSNPGHSFMSSDIFMESTEDCARKDNLFKVVWFVCLPPILGHCRSHMSYVFIFYLHIVVCVQNCSF